MKKVLVIAAAAFIAILLSGCGKIEKDEVHDFKIVTRATDYYTKEVSVDTLYLDDIDDYVMLYSPEEILTCEHFAEIRFKKKITFYNSIDATFDFLIDGENVLKARFVTGAQSIPVYDEFVVYSSSEYSLHLLYEYQTHQSLPVTSIDRNEYEALETINSILNRHMREQAERQLGKNVWKGFKIVVKEFDYTGAFTFQSVDKEDIESFIVKVEPEYNENNEPCARMNLKNEIKDAYKNSVARFDFYLEGERIMAAYRIIGNGTIDADIRWRFVLLQSEQNKRSYDIVYEYYGEEVRARHEIYGIPLKVNRIKNSQKLALETINAYLRK